MNIVQKLTLRHLQLNKKRALVTTLGIIASTALITAMVVGICSFFSFFGDIDVTQTGHWHAEYQDLSQEQIDALKNDPRIESVSIYDTDFDYSGICLHSDAKDRFKYGTIRSTNKEGILTKVVTDYEGVLPANKDEIAIEAEFLNRSNINAKIGDTITFDLGERYFINPDGTTTTIGGKYNSTEHFDKLTEVTCKITAILHGNTATQGYTVLRCIGDDFPTKNITSIVLSKCNYTALKQIEKITEDHGLTLYHYNTEFLVSVFAVNLNAGGIAGALKAGIGALVIIMVTAVILIYNAFGMSLTERIKYLGMLASVGATRRQKRGSIFFEGFALGIIGIPLGMLVGYLGAFVTVKVLAGAMIKVNMLPGAENVVGGIKVSAPFFMYVLIILLSALTILISAVIPAIKASKIMPIEALRQTDSIKVKARSLKINPLFRKFFGYEGEIAYKNIKRNGAKGRVISLSIGVSVVMFLTIIFFCKAFEKANAFEFNLPYQVYASSYVYDSDELKEIIESTDGVDRVYANDYILFNYKHDADDPNYIPPNDKILNPDYLEKGFENVFNDRTIALSIIDDNEFIKLLEANGLDKSEYFGGDLKGVLLDDFYRKPSKKHVFNEGIIGEKVFYDNQEANPPAVTIAGMVSFDKENFIFNMVPKNTVAVFVPESMYFEKAVEILGSDMAVKTLAIETKDSDKVYEELVKLYDDKTIEGFNCGNLESQGAIMKTVMFLLKTIMIGFTVLVTLIALANMVNVISTGIVMRRKEFAMLRSVGLSPKGFKRMISMETILYGARALIAGIPLSMLATFFMVKASNGVMKFEIDVLMYLLVTLAVFAIIGISMLMSASKVQNDEIIEVLKEDIC
jgi:putative ABC transport system permease protein